MNRNRTRYTGKPKRRGGIENTREDDLLVLDALDRADHDKEMVQDIAKSYGLNKNQMIGRMHRVRNEYFAHDCQCKKPENKDFGMPRRWWA